MKLLGMEKTIEKIKQKFITIETIHYNKDIQNILDRFGAGKFLKINKIFVTKFRNDYIVFVILNTTLGNYLIVDIPSQFSDSHKIFEKIIYQLGLNNPLQPHPVQKGILLSHSNFSKFGIIGLKIFK